MKTVIETRPKVTVAILCLGLAAAASGTAAEFRVPADYPNLALRLPGWSFALNGGE